MDRIYVTESGDICQQVTNSGRGTEISRTCSGESGTDS